MTTPLEDYCNAVCNLYNARNKLDNSSGYPEKSAAKNYKDACADVRDTLLALLRDEERERKRNDIC